jgi:hypothetical protein
VLTQGSLWQLYFALSPAERKTALSKDGISLARPDRQWLAETFRQRAKEQSGWRLSNDPSVTIRTAQDDAFSDPDTIPLLTLKVVKQDYPKYGPGKHGYMLYVEGVKDGESVEFTDNLGAFPMYSAEREAELKKKASPSATGAPHP